MSDEEFSYRCQYPGKIISDVYKRPKDGEWEKVLNLGKPRCDMEVLMVGTKIFVYGGFNGIINGKPLCTTEIEIIDIQTNTVTSAEYRLPLGVCGTSVAWHGDDILMIGGKRQGNKSRAVMKLDFVDKTILSLRDLNEDRSNSITIPVQYDQVMVLGGAGIEGTKCGELRQWDESIQDYRWKNWGKVSGSEHIINPDEYSTVSTTFCVNGGDTDNFPAFDIDSNFVFGNEESPFLMEITGDMKTKFYPAPMRLQQKTGQMGYRKDHNTVYFISGTDTTYSLFSKKTFKLDITSKEVTRSGNIDIGRYSFAIAELGDKLWMTGGITEENTYLNSVEAFNLKTEKWEKAPSMKTKRSGHFMWTDPAANRVYIGGGVSEEGGAPLNTIEFLDISKGGSWEAFEHTLSSPLYGATCTLADNGQDYHIIGGSMGADFDSTATKDVRIMSRSQPGPMRVYEQMKVARHNAFAMITGVKNDQLFVMGGTEEPVIDIYDLKDTITTWTKSATRAIENDVFV